MLVKTTLDRYMYCALSKTILKYVVYCLLYILQCDFCSVSRQLCSWLVIVDLEVCSDCVSVQEHVPDSINVQLYRPIEGW